MFSSRLLLIVCLVAGCNHKVKGRLDPFGSDVDLDDVPTSVTPPGGTFAFRPTVTVIKETTADQTGSLQLMAPGDDTYLSGGSHRAGCQQPDLDKPEGERRHSACVEIAQTGELSYYLAPGWFIHQARSAVRQEHYEINLVAEEVEIDGFPEPELDTSCRIYKGKDEVETLTLVMKFKEFELETTSLLDAPGKDPEPRIETIPGEGSKERSTMHRPKWDVDGGCTMQIDHWNLNGVSNGTFTCTDFEGPYQNISGPWTCDGYW